MPEVRSWVPGEPKFKIGDVVIKHGSPSRTLMDVNREFMIVKVLTDQSDMHGHAYCGGEEWSSGGAWEDELILIRPSSSNLPEGYIIVRTGQRVEIVVEDVFYTSGTLRVGDSGLPYLSVPMHRWKNEATNA